MKVLLACERSAGHIFPALSIGKKIVQGDLLGCTKEAPGKVYFFATSADLRSYIEESGFRVFGRSFPSRKLVWEGVWRFFEALIIILKLRPDKVIGFGGRDSFFMVLFGALIGADTAIYEPNCSFGKSNRILAFGARQIWRGFSPQKLQRKSKVIGVPLRENIKRVNKVRARKMLNFDEQPVIFCLGGSQGSSFLNQIFIRFIRDLQGRCQVIHLTGKRQYCEMLGYYGEIKGNKFIKDFFYEVELLYSAADIVVSRAGAGTLAEIAFYKLPALLVPLSSAGAHQNQNAFYFQERQAALVCRQDEFCFADFSSKLSGLISNVNLREALKANLERIRLGVGFEEFGGSINW